jgi:hypothetical protein
MLPTAISTAAHAAENYNPSQVINFLVVIGGLMLLRMVWKAWCVLLERHTRGPKAKR